MQLTCMPRTKVCIGLLALQAAAMSCAHCWAACSSLCSSEMRAASVQGSSRGLLHWWAQASPPTSALVPLLLGVGWPAASSMSSALLGLCLPAAAAKVPYFLAVPAAAAVAMVAAPQVQAPRATTAVVGASAAARGTLMLPGMLGEPGWVARMLTPSLTAHPASVLAAAAVVSSGVLLPHTLLTPD